MLMNSVRITQTDKEYILRIHYSEKDRAKAIKGYRWDINLKSWIYPRTLRSYEALIAEFGDDLINLEITPPEIAIVPVSIERPHKEDRGLQDEFAIIRKQLEALLESKKLSESELGKMINELSLAKEEATKNLFEKEQEIIILKEQKDKSEKELERLRNIKITHDFSHQIKEILKRSTGGDKEFNLFVDKITIDRSAAIDTSKYLEDTFRKLLNEKDRSLSLHELIMRSKDADMLSPEATNLAHIVRSQRNIIAHEKVDIRTQQARILLILFAAAVLWPLLPE